MTPQHTHVVQIRTKRVECLREAYNCIALEISPASSGKPLWRSEAVDVAEGLCVIDTWARLPVFQDDFDIKLKVSKFILTCAPVLAHTPGSVLLAPCKKKV